ncbi:hypothetical protein DNO_0738 [Dichelobacter nodosus VCS1703A]|uniref:Uncharacterized protein n=1 Tax=Dichelobacter nodosus (strain VCS1703A) TaxID=246195 RepID=A5EV10_DICNV|nr:hypothetical protein DNO_0738 [Dichelobacter nodosus VCS1703A]
MKFLIIPVFFALLFLFLFLSNHFIFPDLFERL